MKRAFSLVELSIVLVILGLLVGGILTGQALIRAAELRSVTTEVQSYQTAVMTFRDKYFALPGDMNNATDFWGAATCPDTAGSGTETCSGDGDSVIEYADSSGEYGESFTFWQHLSNAGLIEGNYTGMAGSGGAKDGLINENIPASKMPNVGWGVRGDGFSNGIAISHLSFFEGSYGNFVYFLGAPRTVSGTTSMTDGFITPQEMWNIDKKIDDARPGTGILRAREDHTNCHDQANSNTLALAEIAEYDLSQSDKNCAAIVVLK